MYCNSLDELLDDGILPESAGLVQRRGALHVGHVWLRSAAQQANNDVQHPTSGRIVESSVTWATSKV